MLAVSASHVVRLIVTLPWDHLLAALALTMALLVFLIAWHR